MSKNNEIWKSKRGVILVIAAAAAMCAVVCLLLLQPAAAPGKPTVPSAATTKAETTDTESIVTDAAEETVNTPARVDELEEVSISLTHGLRITDVGSYTGVYMEDGSDEIVSGVMMIAVTNQGENAIQYAEITLPVGDRNAVFSLSTLPVGSTVILLEQNRMAYAAGEYTTATASNVALFSAPLSLCEDQLEIQILDGAMNITNISGADIAGDIIIYYKNSAADVYYGGITYRVRLQGGMKADEVRQIIASHFSDSGSTIMFVTCGGA